MGTVSHSFFIALAHVVDAKVSEKRSKEIQNEYVLNSTHAYEYYHSPYSFLQEGE